MNDLLEQFLVECRDLIDTATADLLALESAPDDKACLDGVFRGFHTLKGAAGIVDFAAMGRLLHAAEEALAAVRAGSRAVSGELVSACLACLDQVARWLDEVAATGEIPAAPADAAQDLVARFTAWDHPVTAPTGSMPAAPAVTAMRAPGWYAPFMARHRSGRHRARTALRYNPAADCFLRGEDPLAAIARLPDLLAMELTPRQEWPPLDDLDPFRCDLVITALTGSSTDEVNAILRAGLREPEGAGELEVWPVSSGPGTSGTIQLEALAVLEEQARLAANDAVAGFAGRLASAGMVAANVLRSSGWPDAASTVSDAARTAQAEGSGATFIAALRAVLDQSGPDQAGLDQTGLDQSGPEQLGLDQLGLDQTERSREPEPDTFASEHPREPAPRATTTRALRVDVERIDRLVSLMGELSVAKNAVGHTARLAARLAREAADPTSLARALKDQHALLDRLVGELQRAVLGIRMLPMRHVFQNFPRLVREMALELGKTVRLDIEGETTEADKATVEALFEPLLHVLRNALDHGIETADERRAAGKPAHASVRLRAARNGDRVIVEVADDGRGIDPAMVRLAAARRGVASETALEEMSDQAVVELIFSPGFSTSAAVTSLSGRGVGMDAVRAAVTRLGGSVAVTSQPGLGTSVVFTLPFTILMLRVMTVEAGGQLFAVPIDAVIETTRVPRERIARLGAAEAIVLRDRTVPLVRLADLLDLPRAAAADGDASILVASAGGQASVEQLCALEVEAFGERMDVMLRPMDGLLAGVSGFAGTTLVGDGGVLVVLDLQELLGCQELPR
jgi:two-component system chemotaxis sensor kinase CheA